MDPAPTPSTAAHPTIAGHRDINFKIRARCARAFARLQLSQWDRHQDAVRERQVFPAKCLLFPSHSCTKYRVPSMMITLESFGLRVRSHVAIQRAQLLRWRPHRHAPRRALPSCPSLSSIPRPLVTTRGPHQGLWLAHAFARCASAAASSQDESTGGARTGERKAPPKHFAALLDAIVATKPAQSSGTATCRSRLVHRAGTGTAARPRPANVHLVSFL